MEYYCMKVADDPAAMSVKVRNDFASAGYANELGELIPVGPNTARRSHVPGYLILQIELSSKVHELIKRLGYLEFVGGAPHALERDEVERARMQGPGPGELPV